MSDAIVVGIEALSSSVFTALKPSTHASLFRLLFWCCVVVVAKASHFCFSSEIEAEGRKPFPFKLGFDGIVLFEYGFFAQQHSLQKRLVDLELLGNSSWLVVTCTLSFEVEQNNCLQGFAVVLEDTQGAKQNC